MAYDKNKDYQAAINEAVAKGDYKSAAKYEQQRNEKINDMNKSGTNTYGATTTNKYSSYVGGGSSGGSSSGGSTGGGSYNSNYSQYTAPTLGDTWDANTDYQAIINNAVANNDYVTAAKAEQLRNQKIYGTGSDYNTTSMYKGYLDNTDYGTIGQQQMAYGASWQEVLDTYNKRYDKADGTVGLDQYKDDQIMQMMLNYIDDQRALEQYRDMINNWEQDNQRPYEPQRDPRIDELLNQILNRDDFSYDAMNDPLYQLYAQMYQREGDRAVRETLAEAAASAGGMNSYAITAAQQANNYYNSQLGDKIPELYQLAYNMYLNDKESKVQDLGILQNMDATQYNRYRDTMNDWYNDRNFAYGMYRDDIADAQWNKTFNNNNYWAEKEFDNNNYWADKEFNNNNYWKEKDYTDQEIADAKAECEYWMERGIMPDDELIEKSGLNKANVEKYVAQVVAEQGSKGTSGGSYSYTDDDDDDTTTTNDGVSVTSLGIGPVDQSVVENLIMAGGVEIDEKGRYSWVNGWNAKNWQDKLQQYNSQRNPLLDRILI